jgi:hypothetical protein
MHAEHSAAGRLGSGATAKASVTIFEQHTASALDQLHVEVAKRIEARGRAWSNAMGEVQMSLETAIVEGSALVGPSLRLAGAEIGSARDAADRLLQEAADRLREHHAAFSDGWTAPVGKTWRERHPNLWGGGAWIVGALMGALISQAIPAVDERVHLSDMLRGKAIAAGNTTQSVQSKPMREH